jgi:hypothetical protein
MKQPREKNSVVRDNERGKKKDGGREREEECRFFHAANGKAQHYIQSALIYFSFKFWVGWRGGFFHFSFVPNMFTSSSHQVPIKFPVCSLGSQFVP